MGVASAPLAGFGARWAAAAGAMERDAHAQAPPQNTAVPPPGDKGLQQGEGDGFLL